jgi:hypothetical protein
MNFPESQLSNSNIDMSLLLSSSDSFSNWYIIQYLSNWKLELDKHCQSTLMMKLLIRKLNVMVVKLSFLMKQSFCIVCVKYFRSNNYLLWISWEGKSIFNEWELRWIFLCFRSDFWWIRVENVMKKWMKTLSSMNELIEIGKRILIITHRITFISRFSFRTEMIGRSVVTNRMESMFTFPFPLSSFSAQKRIRKFRLIRPSARMWLLPVIRSHLEPIHQTHCRIRTFLSGHRSLL